MLQPQRHDGLSLTLDEVAPDLDTSGDSSILEDSNGPLAAVTVIANVTKCTAGGNELGRRLIAKMLSAIHPKLTCTRQDSQRPLCFVMEVMKNNFVRLNEAGLDTQLCER
jgi:hypothetical protein